MLGKEELSLIKTQVKVVVVFTIIIRTLHGGSHRLQSRQVAKLLLERLRPAPVKLGISSSLSAACLRSFLLAASCALLKLGAADVWNDLHIGRALEHHTPASSEISEALDVILWTAIYLALSSPRAACLLTGMCLMK